MRPEGQSLWALLAICTSEITQDERQHRIHLGTQWNSQLTERAGQLGDSERLAAAGHQGAPSALFAATAFLLKRAQFPRYWPFPTQRGNGLSTGSADELEVGVIWLLKQDSNAGPVG